MINLTFKNITLWRTCKIIPRDLPYMANSSHDDWVSSKQSPVANRRNLSRLQGTQSWCAFLCPSWPTWNANPCKSDGFYQTVQEGVHGSSCSLGICWAGIPTYTPPPQQGWCFLLETEAHCSKFRLQDRIYIQSFQLRLLRRKKKSLIPKLILAPQLQPIFRRFTSKRRKPINNFPR